MDEQERSQNPAILIPVSFEMATNLRAEAKQSPFRQNPRFLKYTFKNIFAFENVIKKNRISGINNRAKVHK